jgi:hypothetical protein
MKTLRLVGQCHAYILYQASGEERLMSNAGSIGPARRRGVSAQRGDAEQSPASVRHAIPPMPLWLNGAVAKLDFGCQPWKMRVSIPSAPGRFARHASASRAGKGSAGVSPLRGLNFMNLPSLALLPRGYSHQVRRLARMGGGSADSSGEANGGRDEEAIRNIFKLHHPHPRKQIAFLKQGESALCC